MNKGRLEAFSDGVLAIIITIMVLEMKVPTGPGSHDVSALGLLWPKFLSYALSYVYIGIYWNNHHHMLHAVERINGKVLWPNLHLLFWLSLVPFVTGWMGENHFAPVPTAAYGFVLLMAAVAFTILQRVLVAQQPEHSRLKTAVRDTRKEWVSMAIYVSAIPLAFVNQWISDALFVTVALIWLVPDRRMESAIARGGE